MQRIGVTFGTPIKFAIMSLPVFTAVCEFNNPNDTYLFEKLGDLRSITLTKGFLELPSARDQLIVIKSSIKCMTSFFNYQIPCYGRILWFELRYETDDYTILSIFDTKGKLLSSQETKHENPLVIPKQNNDMPN